MSTKNEAYKGSIAVAFDDIPPVRLQSILAKKGLTLLGRIALAIKPREFTLRDDWFVDFDAISYAPSLNGTIKIPTHDRDGKEIVFDGASVPLPWLVSLLTSGVLRPLGVMLTASLVHDYAYKYGHLQKHDGTPIEIERHVADRLFRDIIRTVSELPFVAFVAWFAVRLGWPVVKYNKKPRGGKAPVVEYFSLFAVLALLISTAADFNLPALVSVLVAIYVILYLVTATIKRSDLVIQDGDSDR
jgi:hypothetical protein